MSLAATMKSVEPIAGEAARPRPFCGGSMLLTSRCAEAQSRDIKAYDSRRKDGDLNALFAISVNSPSMSMVNYSCCVGSAPEAAHRVTRRVTPQPMRAAVRMEAGDHACL